MTESEINKALRGSELSEGERRAITGKALPLGDDGRRRLFMHLNDLRRKAAVMDWILGGEVKEVERYNYALRKLQVVMKGGHRVELQL